MNRERVEVSDYEEDVIDLSALFRVVLSKIWAVILAAVVGAGAMFGYSKFLVVPQYESSAMIYVLAKSTSISSSFSLSLNQQLTTDFLAIARTRPVLEDVIENLNLDATPDELLGTIAVTNPSDTSMMKFTVTNPDPQLAADIANDLATVVAKRIASVMVTDQPSSVETAIPAKYPVSPNLMKNTALGGIAAAVIVIGIIIALYLLDDTIKTVDDVKKRLNAPVLASFPLEKQKA